jgi:thiol-disulfide isomerase/thioredoxin
MIREQQGRRAQPRPLRGRLRTTVTMFVAFTAALLSPCLPAAEQTDLLTPLAGKVVLVDFWASWCVPCRRSFPWMNAMHDKYREDGLVILAVNLDNDRAEAERFLAEYPAAFRIHYDEDRSLARAFGVSAMPSSFIVGRDGEIQARHLGFRNAQQTDYEAAIRAALTSGGQ